MTLVCGHFGPKVLIEMNRVPNQFISISCPEPTGMQSGTQCRMRCRTQCGMQSGTERGMRCETQYQDQT